MKKKIVAANLKMNLTHKEVKPYLDRFLAKVGEINEVQVVFIPPFTSIPAFADALEESPNFCELGAQDLHWESGGAFTGEISAAMLQALQVKHVVIGHSERRQWFGESDAIVAKKTAAALQAGFHPILCIGETLAERDGNRVEEVLERQLRKCLGDCSSRDLGLSLMNLFGLSERARRRQPLRPKKLMHLSGPFSFRLLTPRLRKASESNTGAASNRKTRRH